MAQTAEMLAALQRPSGAVTGIAEDPTGRLVRSADPFHTDPALEDVKQELRRVGDLLERLVALEEERRAGERQMEALGAMLAGGDAAAAELTDQELLDAFFRTTEGAYAIRTADPHGSRPATDDEAARLDQLVRPRRRRGNG